MIHRLLRWPVLIIVATGLTLVTISVPWMGGYGFPLAWKNGGCPPPGIAVSTSCFLAIGDDWLAFALDILLYTFVLYGLILLAVKYRHRVIKRAIYNF